MAPRNSKSKKQTGKNETPKQGVEAPAKAADETAAPGASEDEQDADNESGDQESEDTLEQLAAEENKPDLEEETEVKSALHLPEPDFALVSTADLPNVKEMVHAGLNIGRTIYKKESETYEQAVDRELDTKELAQSMLACTESERLSARHAILIGKWTAGKMPEWMPADVLSSKGIAIIGGNRRTATTQNLLHEYPNGTVIDLHSKGPDGKPVVEKEKKDFSKMRAYIYWNLSQEQFDYLHSTDNDRKAQKVGDILFEAVQIFVRDIGLSELDMVNQVGPTKFKAFYNGKTEPWYHTGAQIARRIAKLPVDIREQARDKYNKVEGIAHPNDKDIRNLLKFWEAEVGVTKGKSFDTTKAKVVDSRIRPPSITTERYAEILDELAAADPSVLNENGEYDAETPGSLRSDFLKKWWEIKSAGKGGRSTQQAGGIKDLKEMEAGFADTMFTKQFVNLLEGKADAVERDSMLDLQREQEEFTLATVEALKGLVVPAVPDFTHPEKLTEDVISEAEAFYAKVLEIRGTAVAKFDDLVTRLNRGMREGQKRVKEAQASANTGSKKS